MSDTVTLQLPRSEVQGMADSALAAALGCDRVRLPGFAATYYARAARLWEALGDHEQALELEYLAKDCRQRAGF